MPNSLLMIGKSIGPKQKMAASGKTLIDFLQQPAAKRIRRASSSSPPFVRPVSSLDDATASISPDQKLRMDFNKALARSKRNLKLCSDKVSKAIDAGHFRVSVSSSLLCLSLLLMIIFKQPFICVNVYLKPCECVPKERDMWSWRNF